MTSVVLNGVTYTDDANGSTGLANGGHRTRFVPALANFVIEAATQLGLQHASRDAADASESAALASEIAAAASALSAVNAPGTTATSTTSDAIELGSTTLTVQTGKAFVVGQFVTIAYTTTPTNWMHGVITAYNSGTGSLTVNVGTSAGSGTYAAWTVALSGPNFAGSVVVVEYDDRATLRAANPTAGALQAVTGLGLFRWSAGVTELDDDATCFATASGVWLLIAADPDYVFGFWTPVIDDLDYRITTIEDDYGSILRGSFSMSLTSLAAISSSNFTVSIPGAAVDDTVVVNPGNSFGTSGADQGKLSYVAYVSATDTAIISIRNASASTANMTASTWAVLVIKQ